MAKPSNSSLNKEPLSLAELKEAQLDILKRVLAILEEHNVSSFVYYGSLLGVIRHGGYIPWDDDIDLGLIRTEYQKLKNIDWAKYDLSMLSPATSKHCPYAHSKIVDKNSYLEEDIDAQASVSGINIDLFPIDFVPNSKFRRMIKIKTIRLLQLFLSVKIVRIRNDHASIKRLLMRLAKLVLTPINEGWFAEKVDRVAQKLNGSSDSAGCLMGSYHERDITKSDYFKSYEKKLFEDTEVYVPQQYDGVLSSLYGDYMKLPPVEKQVTHHVAKAYILKK